MGQRHQFFIVMPNPIKFRWGQWWTDKTKARKALGNGKTTVIAIHHQWMFGRSALINLMNVMDFTDTKIMSKFNNPFSPDNQTNTYEEWRDLLMNVIQVQANKLHPRGIGYENMCYLNDDEPEMREHFNYGDNNDGITIIDTINRKYCFMNIYDQDLDDENNNVYLLPKLEPVNADAYVTAYYPKNSNKKFTRPLAKYQVLTIREVKKLFPKMTEFNEEKAVV